MYIIFIFILCLVLILGYFIYRKENFIVSNNHNNRNSTIISLKNKGFNPNLVEEVVNMYPDYNEDDLIIHLNSRSTNLLTS